MRRISIDLSASAIAVVLASIAIGLSLASSLESARRVVSWVIACAIAAALLELVADWLDEYVGRVASILLVLLLVATSAGALAFGVLKELDHDVKRIQYLVPQAAKSIAETPQYEKLAKDIHLERRATDFVEQMKAPSSGLVGRAVSSIGIYTFCAILTVLFLSWGPRVLQSINLRLETKKRERVEMISSDAFNRARRYLAASILQAIFVGVVVFAVGTLAGLPAVPPLALLAAAASIAPIIGIFVGMIPLLLFALAFATPSMAVALTLFAFGLQATANLYWHPLLVGWSRLYLGPTTVVIAAMFGFELYGVGGTVYAVSLAVFATAIIEGLRTERRVHAIAPPAPIPSTPTAPTTAS